MHSKGEISLLVIPHMCDDREIHFLKLFKGCDAIASFHDVFEDSTAVHIILELCTGGELFDQIVERVRSHNMEPSEWKFLEAVF